MAEPWEEKVRVHLAMAEQKHPNFCGMRAIYGEVKDLERAIDSGSDEDVRRESLHLAVVAIRMHNLFEELE